MDRTVKEQFVFLFCFVLVSVLRSSLGTSGNTAEKKVVDACRLIGINLKMSRLRVSSGYE